MAPPQGQMRPGRQLAVLGLLFVILYAMVFFFDAPKNAGFKERLEPRLGMDLIGGTRVVYQAKTANGSPPPAGNMETAREIIDQRVNGLGVSEAEVVVEGDRNIVVSVAGKSDDLLKTVGQASQLRFRKVLKITSGLGPAPATPAPSGSAVPAPGASTGAKAPAAKPAPTTPASGSAGQGGGAPAPTTPAPSPSAAGTPAPSASAAPLSADAAAQLAAVRKKVGEPAWKVATALKEPSADPAQATALKPFGTLTGLEVDVLPAEMQFNVPTVTCDQLAKRTAGAVDDSKKRVVACDDRGGKHFLDVAKVEGTDIDSATPQINTQDNQWVVSLQFTGEGDKKWTALTREAFENTGQACDQSALGDEQHCLVAVVLDTKVVSAPQILGVLSGQSQISGSFTQATAADLANQLKYGALPVTFTQLEARDISATLGTTQLKAGLLAAGIGMLLVAIYSFFYYRLLGSVIFLSLILSALLTFGALVVLGRTIGFTLTLAGISGFIVSLGVAADSFVIYFERLKDEIRDGRTPRSAVPRAWLRARRTIISANTITILAAVVLYVVSVGVVQGFAFALGLSTVLDLVVVFLFRHPIMTMFARTKAFMSPRVSGLGRVLKSSDPVAPVESSAPRMKEA